MTEPSEQPAKPSVPFPVRFLATGFFSGYSPVASGTAGSLVALAFFAIPSMRDRDVLAVVTIATFFIGAFASGIMERAHGEDPSIVVIDEIVGMWISLFSLPLTVPVIIAAFLLFRVFDIFKPPPARRLEHVKGGWGVMLDDVVAGVYANLSVRILLLAIPGLM